jgi:VIT1/CCC1 family predicted Fe2+/Mn2+ transporter
MDPTETPANDDRPSFGGTWLREVLMGAQDNLTNVLAVVLGVAIGSGDLHAVALAGLAAALAEAISMGGVLYTTTGAERDLPPGFPGARVGSPRRSSPLAAGVATFLAAAVAGGIPLVPFVFLPLGKAAVASVVVSLAALFALGGWKGRITGTTPVKDGLRFLLVGGLAAVAAAGLGALLRTSPT